jgi:phospholipid/cholesterol/gamma-HCH transport system ATP-binding protein
VIRIQDLGKKFDRDWLFRLVSIDIPTGASAALVGPSGSGKSILLKIVAGLIEPTEGTIQTHREELGMLFQKNALFDSLTVEENLLFPLKERKGIVGAEATKRARWFLKEVGLAGNESLYPDEISGGMQKRLGIARALIVEPKVILYDEPTAGLDPITSRMIADLIRKLRGDREATLLTVTNDMQRAYQLGDRVYLLAQGRVSGGGTPQEIQNTKDPAIRQFIYGLKQGPLTSDFA